MEYQYDSLYIQRTWEIWADGQAEARDNWQPWCDSDEILSLIEQGKIDTTPLITYRFALEDIEKAYEIFENKLDGVIKIAVTTE